MRISTFLESLSLCEEAYSVLMFYRYFDILKIASNNTSSWLATKHLQRAEFHIRKKNPIFFIQLPSIWLKRQNQYLCYRYLLNKVITGLGFHWQSEPAHKTEFELSMCLYGCRQNKLALCGGFHTLNYVVLLKDTFRMLIIK